MKVLKTITVFAFLCFLITSADGVHAQTIAFPGAEGFGKYAAGGRGGKVAEVTNLDDSGPGSFRAALEAFPGEPLTVVFRVGGLIELKSNIVIRRSHLTVAGQTAPGDGICLKNFSFMVNGAGIGGPKGDIIIRYIRSRPGGTLKTGLYGFDMENCHDVIVDHCSFSWANEENAAMYDTKNVTVQWCIVSEGLYEAGHAKGHRSYGGVWGGQYATYHHNLLAHLNSRAVRFDGSRAHDTVALVDYRNNVIYNWGNPNACYGGEVRIPGGVSHVNMVNNYYKPGPATSATLKFISALYEKNAANAVGQWYLAGNIMEGDKKLTNHNTDGLDLEKLPDTLRGNAISKAEFPVKETIKLQSAKDAYASVLRNAGANIPTQDPVDQRIIKEAKTGTATGMGAFGKPGIIDLPAAVGGWPQYKNGTPPADTDHDGMPDDYEKKNQLNPSNAADGAMLTATGYSNLEVYLNAIK